MRLRLFAVCLVAMLGGCHKAPSLVGKWSGTIFNQSATAEFKADHSVALVITAGSMSANFSGAYKRGQKKLTLTLKDYTLSNVPPELGGAAHSLLDPLKNKTYVGSYHFNSPDELAITYNGKTDLMTRQKDTSSG